MSSLGVNNSEKSFPKEVILERTTNRNLTIKILTKWLNFTHLQEFETMKVGDVVKITNAFFAYKYHKHVQVPRATFEYSKDGKEPEFQVRQITLFGPVNESFFEERTLSPSFFDPSLKAEVRKVVV